MKNTCIKVGLIGTSCAGKTTMAYEILSALKRRGINADGVLQLDRRFSFQRELLETDELAQWSFIANQVKAEADMALRPGTDVLICDRSPLDFYAYYVWQYGDNAHLRNFVSDWISRTYKKLYLLPALPYKDDGARLNEKGRDEADEHVRKEAHRLAVNWKVDIQVVHPLAGPGLFSRDMVAADVLRLVGTPLCDDDLKLIPSIIDLPKVLVGGSYAFNRQKKWSDVDVYIEGSTPIETNHPDLEKYVTRLSDVYGVPVEVRQVVPMVFEYLKSQGFKYFEKLDEANK